VTRFLNKLGLNWIDVVIFIPFALLYTAFGVFWTLGSSKLMAGDPTSTLQQKKDIMYYLLWFCAMGYAVLANTAVLWRRAPRGGLIAFVVMLGVMVGTFFGLTFLTEALRDPSVIAPSTKVLSIAIGDILVLLPIVTSSIVFIIAWIVSGFSNHLRSQPVVQGLQRLGVALMLIPVIQFCVIFFLPRWDDEVRGVVFVHAMSLGLMWGLFLGGALGSNMSRRNENNAAVTAK
jgi:hypothetical protein